MTLQKQKDDWQTIPILPCVSINETLSFWQALGYNITYKQTHPYQYGVVERNNYSLHFGRVKGMDAANNFYTGCLVMVSNAFEVYQMLSTHLKQHLGKVPHTGIPRISKMKPHATRFTLTDVSGNSIIFVSKGEKDQEVWEQADAKSISKLQKAIATANRLRDYKDDYDAAAKTLDSALRSAADTDPDLAEALVMRIEIASHRGEHVRETECWLKLKSLGVDDHFLSMMQTRHKA